MTSSIVFNYLQIFLSGKLFFVIPDYKPCFMSKKYYIKYIIFTPLLMMAFGLYSYLSAYDSLCDPNAEKTRKSVAARLVRCGRIT